MVAAVLLAVAGVLTRAKGAGRAPAAAEAPGVIDGLVASMAEMAGSLGLPTEPSSGDLAACEADLRTARSRRAEWDGVCDRVHDAEKEAAEAGRLAGEAAGAEARAQQILDETAANWSAWLARRDLDGLTPEGLQDVLALVNDARTADGRRAAADSEMAAIAEKAAEWDASARRCLAAAHRPDSGLSDEALRTALIALDGALDRRQDLLREVTALERTVNVGLASCRDLERANEDLASGDVGVWKDELRTASTKLIALRGERDAAIKDATEAQGEWQSIERSADLARLQGERESLTAELAELVHEYRLVSAATALIAETLKTFVRERQPAVLASGSAAFATVTGGRYTAVQLDAEAELQSVVVIDDKGRLKKPGALSTGTQQQLYLAIRLALADEFGRSNVPLPLIMDDCLVNFDPRRAAAVAGLLAERSADGQCLLFTCHPETAALMEAQKSADRPVRVIEMPGS